MKKLNLGISILVAVVFVFLGLKYVDKTRTTSEISNWTPPPGWGAPRDLSSDRNTKSTNLTLEDLPPLVAAKYQAIYQAAMERDYDKLVAEAEGAEEVLASLSQDKKEDVFKFIPPLLKAPYLRNDYPDFDYTSYHWPATLERALTDEEYENVRSTGDAFGAGGYQIIITKDGKWISFGYDI